MRGKPRMLFSGQALALILWAGAALALAGCGAALPRPQRAPGPIPARSTPAAPTTVVVTLLPAGTRAPTSERTATPEYDGTSEAPAAALWKDCAIALGWAGCDPGAPVIAGRAAFTDRNGPALVALDLTGGPSWAAPVRADWMAWSPRGDRLLASLGEGRYRVYDAAGSLEEEMESPAPPAWQPDGSLSRDGTVRSAEGYEARLEQPAEAGLRIQVKKPGEEQSIGLGNPSADQLHQLVGWVPGTSLLLGQVSTAGNAAMLQGGLLYTADTATGARTNLDVRAPLGSRARYRWNPGAPVLALLAVGSVESEYPTLATVDFSSGAVAFPLPEGVEVLAFSWHPSGDRLAVAVVPWERGPGFEQPGIYEVDPRTGRSVPLTRPPEGARDVEPYWTADGETLLFLRWFENGVLEIRARRAAGGEDWVVVEGLSAPCDLREAGCSGHNGAAFGPLP